MLVRKGLALNTIFSTKTDDSSFIKIECLTPEITVLGFSIFVDEYICLAMLW